MLMLLLMMVVVFGVVATPWTFDVTQGTTVNRRSMSFSLGCLLPQVVVL
jgi:hypothetical protein